MSDITGVNVRSANTKLHPRSTHKEHPTRHVLQPREDYINQLIYLANCAE